MDMSVSSGSLARSAKINFTYIPKHNDELKEVYKHLYTAYLKGYATILYYLWQSSRQFDKYVWYNHIHPEICYIWQQIHSPWMYILYIHAFRDTSESDGIATKPIYITYYELASLLDYSDVNTVFPI